MSKLKIKHYKNQLSSYEYWLSKLIEVNDELKETKRIIEEPKVAQFGEKKITNFSDDQLFKYHGVLEREEQLIKTRNEAERNLLNCVNLLNSCGQDVSSMLYGVYIKGVAGVDVAVTHNYSRGQMFRIIDDELAKI